MTSYTKIFWMFNCAQQCIIQEYVHTKFIKCYLSLLRNIFHRLRKQKCSSYSYLTIHSKNLGMRFLIRGFKWLEHKT